MGYIRVASSGRICATINFAGSRPIFGMDKCITGPTRVLWAYQKHGACQKYWAGTGTSGSTSEPCFLDLPFFGWPRPPSAPASAAAPSGGRTSALFLRGLSNEDLEAGFKEIRKNS